MKIRIKKKSPVEWIFTIIVSLFMFSQGLINLFHFPGMISYFIDLLLLVLVFLNLKKSFGRTKNQKILLSFIVIFFVYVTITYFFHFQSILFYLWGLRNTFRYYLFFILCILFLKENSVDDYCSFFEKLIYVNLFFCLFEFFVLKLNQDNIGGIFGTTEGCNGYLNIFLVITSTYEVVQFLLRKKKTLPVLITIAICSFEAAIAELKFFFVELIIIIALAVLNTSFSFRKLLLVLASIGFLILGITILIYIFPQWADTFSLKSFIEIGSSSEGYTNSGDLNRLNAISTLSRKYITKPFEQAFGLGLGNADYSLTFSFLMSPFFKQYGWLHYNWLADSFLFIELGWIGLIFYYAFFILIFALSSKIKKRNPEKKSICLIAQILAIMAITISIYDSSLKTEAGYMLYLFLTFPFINNNQTAKINKKI